MAQRRTLYYDGTTALWRDPVDGIMRGPLADAGVALAEHEVTVLVPAEDILLTQVALPPIRQAKRRLTAARFALEDRLAGRIEQLHFALGTAQGGDETPVAVVDELQMRAWCDAFEAARLNVVRVVPDCLALPMPESGGWQMARIEDRILVRRHAQQGFACSPDLVPILAEAYTAPEVVELHGTSQDAIQTVSDETIFDPAPEFRPHTHAGRDALIGLLLDNAETGKPGINLRQGDFAPNNASESRWRPYRLTAGLAASWLAVTLLAHGVETWQLNQRIATLEAQTQTAFRDAFPGVETINDLRVQAEQGIASLRGHSGSTGLFPVLAATADVAGRDDSLEVQGMQYRNATLDLSIRGKNVQSVETLRAGFANRPGLELTVQSADANADGVQIRASVSQGQPS